MEQFLWFLFSVVWSQMGWFLSRRVSECARKATWTAKAKASLLSLTREREKKQNFSVCVEGWKKRKRERRRRRKEIFSASYDIDTLQRERGKGKDILSLDYIPTQLTNLVLLSTLKIICLSTQ